MIFQSSYWFTAQVSQDPDSSVESEFDYKYFESEPPGLIPRIRIEHLTKVSTHNQSENSQPKSVHPIKVSTSSEIEYTHTHTHKYKTK